MNSPHDALTLQMLEWIDHGRYSYAEILNVWKSSCPRLTIWEDACADGLVASEPGMFGLVTLTEKGRKLLSRDST